MDKFVIEGGKTLNGTVIAGGSKNAALPILFASLLTDQEITLHSVPNGLKDIQTAKQVLECFGANVKLQDRSVVLHNPKLKGIEAPYDLVRTMRASVLALGPLLARERKAKISMPGGCAIGTRPIDIHLEAFEKMGASFELEEGYIIGSCQKGLKGAQIELRFPSVGATENILMAAALAEGTTVVQNAAMEPEISDLANFLVSMGARIEGIDSNELIIEGVPSLQGSEYTVMFDRIEAGTLLLTGLITGGKVTVENVRPDCLERFFKVLSLAGATVQIEGDAVTLFAKDDLQPMNIITEPYPGFPTDLQAQTMALFCTVDGVSEIHERIFENRFMHVSELIRMGANIDINGNFAKVHGKKGCLKGATVMATDLRASASLILAGLAAKGTTQVRRIYHLDRGYEQLEKKLASLGASVSRVKE